LTSITTPLPIQILMSEILLLHLWEFMVFTTLFVSKYKDYNIFFKFSKLNFVASIYTLFNYWSWLKSSTPPISYYVIIPMAPFLATSGSCSESQEHTW
jgi:hypothetical protein